MDEQVYYDGIRYNSYKELAEYLDVSIEKINKIIEEELYHGKPVTKYMLKPEDTASCNDRNKYTISIRRLI